ncbi:MAG: 7-cyano-7-deazaguanine synthase QueC [Legionellales bacterium]|jgi:7-cyano-7-deazaguanine synthase|nr:7-cyano-7-deazaguanine synthase QueC [Legionellales bacterium]MBK68488.1 7-cyano-7-deazaguanine synthase QueC [Legionellales bacterium]|tara:strand:- start:1044 stop:1721 length:678 start_codon:yes stop_codon:yes gene_type:complete
MRNSKKAIILLSGGLDSATTLAIAKKLGFDCYALSFNYKQRHMSELNAAKNVAKKLKLTEHKIIEIDLTQIGGSALTDSKIDVPNSPTKGIPITYVPARNTMFLSYALAWAEVIGSSDIFIGVNAVDYSGYPDCRPEYIEAYEKLAALATKAGVEGVGFKIHAPLIKLSKSEIIKEGLALGVDFSQTVSCYQANDMGFACGLCDSCMFRKEGFDSAGVSDPTKYQ